MYAVLLLAFLQSPQSAQPLRSGCSADDEQLAVVRADDTAEVHLALAGGVETCYKITLTRERKPITGYVLGEALPAVAAFVRDREKVGEASFEARARQALAEATAPKPVASNKTQPAALPPNTPEVFEDFSAPDANGRTVSLSGVRGRVILVTFWSPKNGTSKNRLQSIMPLYNQFSRRDLSAIGISMDPNASHITDALDDITLGWPQVADRGGLAKRYNVDPRLGQTFVLDASRHIVAAGLSGSELTKKVRELLAAP